VHRLKREMGGLPIVINGGLSTAAEARAQLEVGLGTMIGRAAYHRPALMAELELEVVDPDRPVPDPWHIVERMIVYAEERARQGVRLHSITRHMHGVMAGREGARAWRRFLSEVAARPEARAEVLYSALPIIKTGLAA
jgi:tRNA-dihydrouridine synthase A